MVGGGGGDGDDAGRFGFVAFEVAELLGGGFCFVDELFEFDGFGVELGAEPSGECFEFDHHLVEIVAHALVLACLFDLFAWFEFVGVGFESLAEVEEEHECHERDASDHECVGELEVG